MKLFVKVFLISYLVSNAFRYFIEYSRKNWIVSVSISNIKFRFRSSWSSWCTPCVHHIDPNALKSLVGWNMLRTINVKRTNKNNNWNSNRSFFVSQQLFRFNVTTQPVLKHVFQAFDWWSFILNVTSPQFNFCFWFSWQLRACFKYMCCLHYW